MHPRKPARLADSPECNCKERNRPSLHSLAGHLSRLAFERVAAASRAMCSTACTGEGMTTRAARGILTFVFVAGSACSSPTAPDALGGPVLPVAAAPAPASSGLAAAILDLTNAERSRAGRAPLRGNDRLMQAAQIQAEQNARAGRLDHVMPESRYPRVEDRLAAVGYRWSAYGENIAYGQRGAAEVMASWMGSSGHRANILSGNFTELGVGSAPDAAGRLYFAQVFTRPAS